MERERPSSEGEDKAVTAEEIMPVEEAIQLRHEPFIFEITSGKKHLTYMGVAHSHDPEAKMFEEIGQKFAADRPQLVLIEGMTQLADPEMKARFIADTRSRNAVEIIKRRGEPSFVLKLAAEAGVAVECPEPKFSDKIKHVTDQGQIRGYGRDEVFAYYCYRALQSYHRGVDSESPEQYLERRIESFKREAGWTDFEFSISYLKEIGERLLGERANFATADPYRTNPLLSNRQQANHAKYHTLLNDVARQSTLYRDVAIVQNIVDALKRVDRVFVVYGASHAYMEQPALIKRILKTEDAKGPK